MTNDQNKQFAVLLLKYKAKTITADELKILEKYRQSSAENEAYFNRIDSNDQSVWNEQIFEKPASDDIWTKIKEQIPVESQTPVVRMQWRKWAIAASILIIVSTASWMVWYSFQNERRAEGDLVASNLLLPGSDKAILVLPDGKALDLSNASNGNLTNDEQAMVTKQNGSITYLPAMHPASDKIIYHQLIVPKGGQFQIRLSDGTNVWLNALSTMRYPSRFSNGQRKVEITGEAYFEVAKDAGNPFVVSIADMNITVLGTHFNVMGYADEKGIETTLLEGSVMVTAHNKLSKVLKPGQQSILGKDGGLVVTSNFDTEKKIAWKQGQFYFKNDDPATILRQVARWYDVTVVFKGSLPTGRYSGKIDRNLPGNHVLDMLLTGGIRYEIKDKKLYVL